MSAGIVTADGPVPALADNLAVFDKKRTDRNLSLLLGLSGQFNRPLHKQQVLFTIRCEFCWRDHFAEYQ